MGRKKLQPNGASAFSWNDAQVFQLISDMQPEEFVWDTGHSEYHMYTKKCEFWLRLSQLRNIPAWALADKWALLSGNYKQRPKNWKFKAALSFLDGRPKRGMTGNVKVANVDSAGAGTNSNAPTSSSNVPPLSTSPNNLNEQLHPNDDGQNDATFDYLSLEVPKVKNLPKNIKHQESVLNKHVKRTNVLVKSLDALIEPLAHKRQKLSEDEFNDHLKFFESYCPLMEGMQLKDCIKLRRQDAMLPYIDLFDDIEVLPGTSKSDFALYATLMQRLDKADVLEVREKVNFIFKDFFRSEQLNQQNESQNALTSPLHSPTNQQKINHTQKNASLSPPTNRLPLSPIDFSTLDNIQTNQTLAVPATASTLQFHIPNSSQNENISFEDLYTSRDDIFAAPRPSWYQPIAGGSSATTYELYQVAPEFNPSDNLPMTTTIQQVYPFTNPTNETQANYYYLPPNQNNNGNK